MNKRPGLLFAGLAAIVLVTAACVRIAEVPSASSHVPGSTAAIGGETSAPTNGPSDVATPTTAPTETAALTEVPTAAATPAPRNAGTNAPTATATPGEGSGGTGMQSGLIVCIGPDGGGPCVRAADAATVIAAEKAVGVSGGAGIAKAVVTPETCDSAPVSCPAGAAGVGTVTLTTQSGATEKAFVYRSGDGTLAATELP